MSEKPESVFEKLDSQTEKIDDISEKLKGVSVNDLYALAKRTWDYGDFETAQKYYNHISLLRPLDWEAPLYATLCNFKGYHDMFFWTKVPEKLEPVIVSTIKYLNDLDMEKKKKESEMARCIDVIEKFMRSNVDRYFKYTKELNRVNDNYVFELQEWFVDILEEIKNINLKAIKSFCSYLADDCLRVVKEINLLSSNISKEQYDYLTTISLQKWDIDYEELVRRHEELNIISVTSGRDLTPTEKANIMLNGKMYFEYKDKIVTKRLMKRNIFFALVIASSSLVGTIFSFLVAPFTSFAFIISLVTGIALVIKAILEKDRIYCTSILVYKRKKCRLTSNNSIIRESSPGLFGIYIIISLIASFFTGSIMSFLIFTSGFNAELYIKIVYCVCGVVNLAAQYVNIILTYASSSYNGDYKYLYNGRYYCFK